MMLVYVGMIIPNVSTGWGTWAARIADLQADREPIDLWNEDLLSPNQRCTISQAFLSCQEVGDILSHWESQQKSTEQVLGIGVVKTYNFSENTSSHPAWSNNLIVKQIVAATPPRPSSKIMKNQSGWCIFCATLWKHNKQTSYYRGLLLLWHICLMCCAWAYIMQEVECSSTECRDIEF